MLCKDFSECSTVNSGNNCGEIRGTRKNFQKNIIDY